MRLIFAILGALSMLAFQPLKAQTLDSTSVHFGWILDDGTIFMELQGIYNDDKIMEVFNHRVKAFPLDKQDNSRMCKYRTLDSLYEAKSPFQSGDRVLVLINGALRPGSFDGFVYVHNQISGSYLPGGHIMLDDHKGLPKCSQDGCDNYCVRILIFTISDNPPTTSNINQLHEIKDSTAVPFMLKMLIEETRTPIYSNTSSYCRQLFFIYSDTSDQYLFEKSCWTPGFGMISKYFRAIHVKGDGFSSEEIFFPDSSDGTPTIQFLDTFEYDGINYFFAMASWHEYNRMIVINDNGNKMKIVAESNTFGE